MSRAEEMEMKFSVFRIKIEWDHIFFRTCKPRGDPLYKIKVCFLKFEGNKKSLPDLQFEIVECDRGYSCQPLTPFPGFPFGSSGGPFGYVFLSFWPIINHKSFQTNCFLDL